VRFDAIAPAGLAPGMTAPLLVFHDPEDREVPFAEGAELARRWPGAELRPAAGLGHLRILRDEGCVAAAVGFLGGSLGKPADL
jgi:pimeloyl-ACP methyl ester carboxylesterase